MDQRQPDLIEFSKNVLSQLWRFNSTRQYEILSRLPKEIQKKAKTKNKNIAFKATPIEHDELKNIASMYRMSITQYIMFLHRAFKDSVVEYQTKASKVIGGPGYIEIPESAKKAGKQMHDMGLPTGDKVAEYQSELADVYENLRRAKLA